MNYEIKLNEFNNTNYEFANNLSTLELIVSSFIKKKQSRFQSPKLSN